jgi:hypothetical protein
MDQRALQTDICTGAGGLGFLVSLALQISELLTLYFIGLQINLAYKIDAQNGFNSQRNMRSAQRVEKQKESDSVYSSLLLPFTPFTFLQYCFYSGDVRCRYLAPILYIDNGVRHSITAGASWPIDSEMAQENRDHH